MPDRKMTHPVPDHVVCSGPLGSELEKHAEERLRHYFGYIFTVKALLEVLQADHQKSFLLSQVIREKASYQIDQGFKRATDDYTSFSKTDSMVIDETVTTISLTDAAHFANLGVQDRFKVEMDKIAAHNSGTRVAALWEYLQIYMGNTRWLPHDVNIGADRVVDKLHWALVQSMMNSTYPLICEYNFILYANTAASRMRAYEQVQNNSGNSGRVECAKRYIGLYCNSVEIEKLYRYYRQFFWHDCEHFKLDPSHYLQPVGG